MEFSQRGSWCTFVTDGGLALFGKEMPAANSSSLSQAVEWRDLRREPTHPGVYVKEGVLESFGMTQQELADAIGVSRLSVNEIINGKRGITESTALRLEKLTGVTAEFWLDLQRAYSLWRSRRDEAEALKSIKTLKRR